MSNLYSRRCLGTVAYLVGLPSIPVPFFQSCLDMTQFNSEYVAKDGEFVHPDYIGISYTPTARNEAVKRFLGDWLLQLDCDHQFEPDLLSRMLTTMTRHNLMVLGTKYFKKAPPHIPVVSRWDEETERWMVDVHLDGRLKWEEGQELFRTGAGGGNGLLVKREAFDRIKGELKEEPFTPISPWSEDYSFFLRCMKLGIPYHISPRIETKHLIWKGIGEAEHKEEMEKWGVNYE